MFNPAHTIYVGDLPHDIEAARSLGIKIAAISWGYSTKERLLEHNPDYLIEDIRELNSIL
jgi:phosphoglycolate phosphatase-like HAD superfamily hydrolase